jgi:predicted XRE-type DNA-binding protein
VPTKKAKNAKPLVKGARTRSKNRSKSADKASLSVSVVPKEVLAQEIDAILRYRHLTQTQAGLLTGESPSQISLILAGKLRGFSTDRLMRILLRLGRDVDVVIKPSANPRREGVLRIVGR